MSRPELVYLFLVGVVPLLAAVSGFYWAALRAAARRSAEQRLQGWYDE